MSEHDQRAPVGVAHVVLETDRMEKLLATTDDRNAPHVCRARGLRV